MRKALPFSGLPKPALAPRALAGLQVLEIDRLEFKSNLGHFLSMT